MAEIFLQPTHGRNYANRFEGLLIVVNNLPSYGVYFQLLLEKGA